MALPRPLSTDTPAILVKLGRWTPHDDRELPRVGYGYKPGLTGQELYTSARAWWRLDIKRAMRHPYSVAVKTSLPGIVVGNPDRHVVWGLTYRFLEILFSAVERPLPVRWDGM
jgi:hypothetical protein